MRKIIGLLCLLWVGLAYGQAPSAVSLLDRAAAHYEASNGMRATFVLHDRVEAASTADRVEGSIDMKGDKFVLRTPGMITWYDGTTQWIYVEHNEEVNVSTPKGEELQWTNPVWLLRMYKKGFTPTLQGESTTVNGKAAYEIELQPKKGGDIRAVFLQLEKNSGLPASIRVEGKNGRMHTIRISDVEEGLNQPDRFFVFPEKEYPDAEVVDLR